MGADGHVYRGFVLRVRAAADFEGYRDCHGSHHGGRNTVPTGGSRNPVANLTALPNADLTAVAVPQRNLADSSALRSINDGECKPVTVLPAALLAR